MAPSRPPLLWPMAAPTMAPAAVLKSRSPACALVDTAAAASITTARNFLLILFNMAFSPARPRIGMIRAALI